MTSFWPSSLAEPPPSSQMHPEKSVAATVKTEPCTHEAWRQTVVLTAFCLAARRLSTSVTSLSLTYLFFLADLKNLWSSSECDVGR